MRWAHSAHQMNTNLITPLRIAVPALVWAIFFSPVTANAYTSTGTDGQFQPTVSMILDSTQQLFNFTSIFIPSGVTVSFSGLTSAQPIELLATGNIDIAGTLDVGANNLWIETPGSISVSGALITSGSTLSLVASAVNFSGIISGTITGGGAGAVLCSGNCSGVLPVSGGGVITGGGGDISICSNCSTLSPVPEPEVWAMLFIGLCALFAVSRLRHQNIRLA